MKHFPKSFNLPELTSLQLQNFGFRINDNYRVEPFSTFNKLNSLLLSNCTLSGKGTLCISSVTLVNFTMYNRFHRFSSIELCTPSLCMFAFTTGTPQKISTGTPQGNLLENSPIHDAFIIGLFYCFPLCFPRHKFILFRAWLFTYFSHLYDNLKFFPFQ